MPRGVKTGYMDVLRGLTEQQLEKMSKADLVNLLTSTSKTITANIRRLKESKIAAASPLLAIRKESGQALPREIKRKTAIKMDVDRLKQEIRDLAYISRLKTASVSGTKKWVKKFEAKTGVKIGDLTSSDWEKIRKRIEEGDYSSESIIASYDVTGDSFEYLDELEEMFESKRIAEQTAKQGLSDADLFDVE